MATEKLQDAVKITTRNVVAAPGGVAPAYYKIEEIYYPSSQTYEASLNSEVAQAVAAHATAISSGGQPISLVCRGEQVNWVIPPEGLKI